MPATGVAAVAIGVLVAMLQLQSVIPIVGIVLVSGLYIAMLVCAWAMREVVPRNTVLAWLFGIMASVAGLAVVLLLLGEWWRY